MNPISKHQAPVFLFIVLCLFFFFLFWGGCKISDGDETIPNDGNEDTEITINPGVWVEMGPAPISNTGDTGRVSTIAGLNIVGTMGLVTSKGCIVHPKTRQKEMEILEKTLGVKADIGTISFGSPFVKSGIIANSRGALISDASSGPELGKISEALGFL